jgi:hypothetical protein
MLQYGALVREYLYLGSFGVVQMFGPGRNGAALWPWQQVYFASITRFYVPSRTVIRPPGRG